MVPTIAKVSVLVLCSLGLAVGCASQASPEGEAAAEVTAPPSALPQIKTAFVILMENHNWSSIKGSASAPYINGTLLPAASHTESYTNPPRNHPSEPNYIWLEAGNNLGVRDDKAPSSNHQSTRSHLSSLLDGAGVSWRSYAEGVDGTSCPLTTNGLYAPKHVPFVFFDDVTDRNSASSQNCIEHMRPYTELASDLGSASVARYNFITPDLCNDMHNNTGCATSDAVRNGDTWLSREVPKIMASSAYRDNGAIFITWDESEGGEFPIGMIVLSPLAKGNGYSNHIPYSHSSTLRTMQTIFGVSPFLGDAANATDLSDLFTAPTAPADVVASEVNAPRTNMSDEKNFQDSTGPVVPPGASGLHLSYYGGRVLANVNVVAVSWGPNVSPEVQNGVSDFYKTITDSEYMDWLSEYNTTVPSATGQPGTNQTLGRGTFGGQFTITPTHTSTSLQNADIGAELVAQLTAANLPAPGPDTVYMFNFPPGVKIRLGFSSSCSPGGFCGYHNTVAYQGKQVAYGVVPDFSAASGDCATGCGGTGTIFEKQTSVLSHELIEAVTDPDVNVSLGWTQRGRGEIGDLCHYRTHLHGYNVQLQWSNASGACISSRPGTTTATTP